MRGPAADLASSACHFHSRRTRSPSKLATPSPADTDSGTEGPGSRYASTGPEGT